MLRPREIQIIGTVMDHAMELGRAGCIAIIIIVIMV